MQRIISHNKISHLAQSQDMPIFIRRIIYLYFFASFFEPYLNGAIGAVFKYFILLIIGLIFINIKILKFRPYHFAFVFWFLYKLISVIWSTNLEFFNRHIVSQIGMVLWLISLTAIDFSHKTIDNIVRALWLGSSVMGILCLFFSQSYHNRVEVRQVLVLFGQENDPNNQAAYLAVGFAISLYTVLNKKGNFMLFSATMLINAFAIFKTASRTGFVTVLASAVLLIAINSEKANVANVLKTFFIGVIGLIVLYVIAKKYLPQDSFDRIFGVESYEDGSSRTVLWLNVWNFLLEDLNLLIGGGWGSVIGYNGVYKVCHNTYLSMLADVGLLGTLTFFIPIIKSSWLLLKNRMVLPVCLMLTGAVPAALIDSINKRYFWNAIIFLFIFYNRVKKDLDIEQGKEV